MKDMLIACAVFLALTGPVRAAEGSDCAPIAAGGLNSSYSYAYDAKSFSAFQDFLSQDQSQTVDQARSSATKDGFNAFDYFSVNVEGQDASRDYTSWRNVVKAMKTDIFTQAVSLQYSISKGDEAKLRAYVDCVNGRYGLDAFATPITDNPSQFWYSYQFTLPRDSSERITVSQFSFQNAACSTPPRKGDPLNSLKVTSCNRTSTTLPALIVLTPSDYSAVQTEYDGIAVAKSLPAKISFSGDVYQSGVAQTVVQEADVPGNYIRLMGPPPISSDESSAQWPVPPNVDLLSLETVLSNDYSGRCSVVNRPSFQPSGGVLVLKFSVRDCNMAGFNGSGWATDVTFKIKYRQHIVDRSATVTIQQDGGNSFTLSPSKLQFTDDAGVQTYFDVKIVDEAGADHELYSRDDGTQTLSDTMFVANILTSGSVVIYRR